MTRAAMRLIFVDRGKEFCDVLRRQFRSHPEVQIVCGRFEDLPSFDCVVTAGNSFGLMDAGMDLAVVRFFGRHVMERIQKQILEDYLGEQPVGTCIIVPTDHAAHPIRRPRSDDARAHEHPGNRPCLSRHVGSAYGRAPP
jgi:hypothetical protein